jgi:16S rRNA (guanine1207-N2)-methyltransferase/23S rRNA (guanine1835-N2)-methyltransferase
LKNYPGVFSAHSVDPASKLLLDNLQISETDKRILDMASGNGIFAAVISKNFPLIEIHLLDDFYLAVESSKLNLNDSCLFHYNDSLDDLETDYFDKIVSNPPFHFEYETNIEVSLSIFKGASRCLKPDGLFQVVANRHLNYKTHLVNLFDVVEVVAGSEKFVVYNCSKPIV